MYYSWYLAYSFPSASQKKMRAGDRVNWLFFRKTQKRLASFCSFSWNGQERVEAYFFLDFSLVRFFSSRKRNEQR
jgi:hypothetical protein